jgi:hypothetical protein
VRDEMRSPRTPTIHPRVRFGVGGRGGGQDRRRIQHLFEGGRELEGLELMRMLEPRAQLALPLLERAVEQALLHGIDMRTVLRLRTAIVSKAAHVLANDSFWRHAPVLLKQIEHDCGLTRYRELTHVAESARMSQALHETQQRYELAPPDARGYTVMEAFQELARVCNAYCALGMGELSLEPIESLPALDPLFALSPALELLRKRIEIARSWVLGRSDDCMALHEEMLARILQPDRCGLDEGKRTELVFGLNYGLGAIEAARGSAGAERRAQLLESQPQTRGIAWTLRHVLALNQGNLPEARRCMRRAELYQLQMGAEGPPARLGAGIQLLVHARLGNLLGVKSACDDLTVVAREHPGWRPVLLLARSHQCKLQGDFAGALAPIEEALELIHASGSLYFTPIAAAHVDILNALGRDDEAADRARYYLERVDAKELGTGDTELYAAAAVALARAGEHARAVRLLDNAIAHSQDVGRKGIPIGALYFGRARLAIAANDRTEFEHFAELCAEEFKSTRNPSMTARFERLLQEAARSALATEIQSPNVRELLEMARVPSVYVTLQSRMDECFDMGDRARCALTLLLEHVQRFEGQLYGVYGQEIKLLAALPEETADAATAAWVNAHVLAECASDAQADAAIQAPRRYCDLQGRLLEPVFLYGTQDGTEHLAAVFVHQVTSEPQVADRMLLQTLADTLLMHGDVSGAKLDSAVTA